MMRDAEEGVVVMKPAICSLLLVVLCTLLVGGVAIAQTSPIQAKRLLIVTGQQASGPEAKAADIFKSRLLKRSAVAVDTVKEDAPDLQKQIEGSDAVFVAGSPAHTKLVASLMGQLQMTLPALPNSEKLHPEGFAVKSGKVGPVNYYLIAGADDRGVLYGVGCMLRAITYLPDAVVLPAMDAKEKPAFPLRGGRPSGPCALT
jgi:alpha-glucuronidase